MSGSNHQDNLEIKMDLGELVKLLEGGGWLTRQAIKHSDPKDKKWEEEKKAPTHTKKKDSSDKGKPVKSKELDAKLKVPKTLNEKWELKAKSKVSNDRKEESSESEGSEKSS